MKRFFHYSTWQLLIAAGFALLLARGLYPTVDHALSQIINAIPWNL